MQRKEGALQRGQAPGLEFAGLEDVLSATRALFLAADRMRRRSLQMLTRGQEGQPPGCNLDLLKLKKCFNWLQCWFDMVPTCWHNPRTAPCTAGPALSPHTDLCKICFFSSVAAETSIHQCQGKNAITIAASAQNIVHGYCSCSFAVAPPNRLANP